MSHGLWWKSSSLKGLKYAALITLQALETYECKYAKEVKGKNGEKRPVKPEDNDI